VQLPPVLLSGAQVAVPLALSQAVLSELCALCLRLFFTFGLSIPVGAVVGGGAGLVVGTAAGATTGALGGGAAGYGAYQKKDDFARFGNNTLLKASSGAEVVKGQVFTSVAYARDKVSAAKARLVGGQVGAM